MARPRHDPLTLLAAVAARVPRVELGTAVLLPTLRNPVILAQQVATLDQIAEGRVILGVGIAADRPNIRAEFGAAGVPFEKRVGRLLEGLQLCRALWSGEPVTWEGRWKVENSALLPPPHRPGGPPIWSAGSHPLSLERVGRHFDGWIPNDADAAQWKQHWTGIHATAREAGRDPDALTGATYLTAAVDDDSGRANERLDAYLEQYYGQRAAAIRARQICYAGSAAGLAKVMQDYTKAGVSHLVLRFAGHHERHLGLLAGLRAALGS